MVELLSRSWEWHEATYTHNIQASICPGRRAVTVAYYKITESLVSVNRPLLWKSIEHNVSEMDLFKSSGEGGVTYCGGSHRNS
jgi:hypothetical protein